MNKKELIEAVAEKMESTKVGAERSVNAVIKSIKLGIKKDGMVQLIGFGSFRVKKRKARKGRNPQTGEKIKIKGRNTVTFKAGKTLKDKI